MDIYRKKLFFFTTFLLTNLVLTGCVSNSSGDWSINFNPTGSEEVVNYPPLGEVTKGELGRTLAGWGVRKVLPAIELLEPWRFTEGNFSTPAYFLNAGVGKLTSRKTNMRTNEKWDCFTFEYGRTNNWNFDSNPLQKPPKDGPMDLCRDSKGNFKVWHAVSSSFNAFSIPFDVDYKEIEIEQVNEGTYVQEFVYNGRVGDAVRFVYREFKDNYARPAFTQEVQYDLSLSDEIGFQNLRLKVIDATNTNITYVLTRNF